MCNKHVHADLMLEYAKDAQETSCPWERWESNSLGRWFDLTAHPRWDTEVEYRRKRKTHIVNGKEVAAPLDKVIEDQYIFTWEITPLSDKASAKKHLVTYPNKWDHLVLRGLLFGSCEDAIENFEAYFPSRNLKA